MINLRHILVATDFGEAANAALRYGLALARRFDSALHVLHVAPDVAGRTTAAAGVPVNVRSIQQALVTDALHSLESLVPESDRQGLDLRFAQLTSNTPASAILAYARDETIDLVIVGTHGRHGLAYFFLGSVAQQVSRSAACPVLTVRAHTREFITPDAPAAVDAATRH